ncbi:MAG: substrate-binding domain-containing protein [Tepidisphaeraceae bacterium]
MPSQPSCTSDKAPIRRIAVRFYDWSEWGRQVIRGVQRFAHQLPNWKLYVDASHAPKLVPDDTHWDGLISFINVKSTQYKRLIGRGTTVVYSSSVFSPSLAWLPHVLVNESRIAQSIVRHFIAGGFREIGYAGGSETRYRAIKPAAAAANLPFHSFVDWLDGRDASNKPSFLRRWLQTLPRPIGIATFNIYQAREVINACRKTGIAVPEQVAVVGWDDDTMLSENTEPTITGAILPAETLGYESAKLLNQLLAGGKPPTEPVLVEPSGLLHIRQSSDVSTLPDRDVHLALLHIKEHISEPLKVSQVAHRLGVSRRKFEQDFSRVTGQTPSAAIARLRVERVKQLLIETNWTTQRIAEVCGLTSKQTLHRVFRRHEGLLPSAYRQRYSAV